jgi:hypothetical protein
MPSPHPCRYPTDLSDAGWAVLEPLLPPPARTGRPWKWLRQLVVEAIFHLARSGCQWRMPPRCFPPWPTVFTHVRRWRLDRTPRRTRNRLGVQALVGRAPPGDLRALSRSGRTAPAPAPSPAGSRPSAAGASRCPSTGSARRGGTAWRVRGTAPDAARLPGRPVPPGSGADLRVALALPAPRARPGAPARDGRGHGPRRDDAHRAPPHRSVTAACARALHEVC